MNEDPRTLISEQGEDMACEYPEPDMTMLYPNHGDVTKTDQGVKSDMVPSHTRDILTCLWGARILSMKSHISREVPQQIVADAQGRTKTV